MRTPTRYALWSMLVIAPALMLLSIYVGNLASFQEPVGPHTGLLTMLTTAIALGVTGAIAPDIADPKAEDRPGWSWVIVASAFLQIVVCGFLLVEGPATVWTGAYLPALSVCMSILALILLHVWVASAGMGASPAVGLLTGSAFSAWLFRIGSAQKLDLFCAVSGIATAAALLVAVTVVLCTPEEPHGSA